MLVLLLLVVARCGSVGAGAKRRQSQCLKMRVEGMRSSGTPAVSGRHSQVKSCRGVGWRLQRWLVSVVLLQQTRDQPASQTFVQASQPAQRTAPPNPAAEQNATAPAHARQGRRAKTCFSTRTERKLRPACGRVGSGWAAIGRRLGGEFLAVVFHWRAT